VPAVVADGGRFSCVAKDLDEADMTLFGEIMNPGNGRDDQARTKQMARLLKLGALSVALVLAVVIFSEWYAFGLT